MKKKIIIFFLIIIYSITIIPPVIALENNLEQSGYNELSNLKENEKSENLNEDDKSENLNEDDKSENLNEDEKSESSIENEKSENLIEDEKSENLNEDEKSENLNEDEKSESSIENEKSENLIEDDKSENLNEGIKLNSIQSINMLPIDGIEVPIEAFEFSNGKIEGLKDSWISEQLSFYNLENKNDLKVNIEIPSEIDLIPVTEIGYNAFNKSASVAILSLKFEENDLLVKIGRQAFYNQNELYGEIDFTVLSNLHTIDYMAFAACSSLESIKIPNTVKNLGSSCFYNNASLESVYLENGLLELSDNMFGYSASLKNIELPETLQNLGVQTFISSGLEKIVIPIGITKIPKGCFRYNKNLEEIIFENDITEIGSAAFDGCSSIERMDFKTVKTINNIVAFPISLNTIATQAFRDAFAENTILKISSSVKNIGSEAIYTETLKNVDMTDFDVSTDYNWSSSTYSDSLMGTMPIGIHGGAFKVKAEIPIIFKSKEVYDLFYSKSSSFNAHNRYTYVLPITFRVVDSDILKLNPEWIDIEDIKLYNLPYTFVYNGGVWEKDTTYSLPAYPTHNHIEGNSIYKDAWQVNGSSISISSKVRSSEIIYSSCYGELTDSRIPVGFGYEAYVVIGENRYLIPDVSGIPTIDIDLNTINENDSVNIEVIIKDDNFYDNGYGNYYMVTYIDSLGLQTDIKFNQYTVMDIISNQAVDSVCLQPNYNRTGEDMYTIKVKGYNARNNTTQLGTGDKSLLTLTLNFKLNMCREIIEIDAPEDTLLEHLYLDEMSFLDGLKTYHSGIFCMGENDWSILGDVNFSVVGAYLNQPGAENKVSWSLSDSDIQKHHLVAGENISFSGEIFVKNPYEVVFKDGDENEKVIYVPAGGSVDEESIPELPLKEGYETDWVLSDGAIDDVLSDIQENIEVELEYKPIVYNINYDNLKNTLVENPINYTIESETIVLNRPSALGYIFEGWTFESEVEPILDVEITSGSTGNRSFYANWSLQPYSIMYLNIDNAVFVTDNPITYNIESETFTLVNPIKSNYDFIGWTSESLTEPTMNVVIPKGSYNDLEFTANWEPKKTSGSESSTSRSILVDVTYNSGGKVNPSGKFYVKYNSDKTIVITPDEGYMIKGIYVNDEYCGNFNVYTLENIKSTQKVEVIFEKVNEILNVSSILNSIDHISYICGYQDGTFRPDDNITRNEVAQIFYRLLLDKKTDKLIYFKDVPLDAWYSEGVLTLASKGYMVGIGNSLFEPYREITRAEFATIAVRFLVDDAGVESLNCSFSDVSEGAWYYNFVCIANKMGWVVGYDDGTFRPNAKITRAEVVTIINRMLNRNFDTTIKNIEDLNIFSDVSKKHWAFYDIMEASIYHEYFKNNGVEFWKNYE